MNVTIRSGVPSDFIKIVELFRECSVFAKVPHKMVNTVERMIDEQKFFSCFVAEKDNGDIVGFASHYLCYYTWIGKTLYLDDLFVTSEFRGMGIGTRLITAVIQLAKDEKCHKLRWQVAEWNTRAKKFYTRLGAVIDDTEQNCDLLF